jgi:short-subunit dehydrogenase
MNTLANDRKNLIESGGSMTKELFFITGVSTGLGRAIAEVAAQAGNPVVGTVRNPADLADFERIRPKKKFGKILDVTTEKFMRKRSSRNLTKRSRSGKTSQNRLILSESSERTSS